MAKNGTKADKRIEQHLHEYGKGWYDMMVRIWRDRLQMMRVYRTGSLLGSVAGSGLQQKGYSMQAAFRFLEYGVYVDAGTGNGYTRGNPGDLHFLGKAYRQAHHLGRRRKKRPWFSVSWSISTRVLADHAASIIGDDYVSFYDEFLDAK